MARALRQSTAISTPSVVVAVTAASVDVDGTPVFIRQGERMSAGARVVKLAPRLFVAGEGDDNEINALMAQRRAELWPTA